MKIYRGHKVCKRKRYGKNMPSTKQAFLEEKRIPTNVEGFLDINEMVEKDKLFEFNIAM